MWCRGRYSIVNVQESPTSPIRSQNSHDSSDCSNLLAWLPCLVSRAHLLRGWIRRTSSYSFPCSRGHRRCRCQDRALRTLRLVVNGPKDFEQQTRILAHPHLLQLVLRSRCQPAGGRHPSSAGQPTSAFFSSHSNWTAPVQGRSSAAAACGLKQMMLPGQH